MSGRWDTKKQFDRASGLTLIGDVQQRRPYDFTSVLCGARLKRGRLDL
jgi:hypothetical protein